MATTTRATVEDVLRLGALGERYELVDGELVPMSPTGKEHGDVDGYVAWVFNSYVIPRRLGKIVVGEVLLQLDPNRGIARAPDVAFIRQDRWDAQSTRPGAFLGAPDLAVEIVSPSDSAKDGQDKVNNWLAYGALGVLVMYPGWGGVVYWRKEGAIRLMGDDAIDLDPALPGFRVKVDDLFPPRDAVETTAE